MHIFNTVIDANIKFKRLQQHPGVTVLRPPPACGRGRGCADAPASGRSSTRSAARPRSTSPGRPRRSSQTSAQSTKTSWSASSQRNTRPNALFWFLFPLPVPPPFQMSSGRTTNRRKRVFLHHKHAAMEVSRPKVCFLQRNTEIKWCRAVGLAFTQ